MHYEHIEQWEFHTCREIAEVAKRVGAASIKLERSEYWPEAIYPIAYAADNMRRTS